MITYILKLTQIMGRYNNCGIINSYIIKHDRPYLSSHNRIKPINRLIEHNKLWFTAQCKPEGNLLLHPLRKLSDISFNIYRWEKLLHPVKLLLIKIWIHSLIIMHHINCIRLQKIKHIIRNVSHMSFNPCIFIYRLTINKHFPCILSQYSCNMPDKCRFAGSVWAYKPVDSSFFHVHIHTIKCRKIVKFFH